MSVLDQPERWKSVDPKSMRLLVESFPEQVRQAAANTRGLTLQVGRNAKNLNNVDPTPVEVIESFKKKLSDKAG